MAPFFRDPNLDDDEEQGGVQLSSGGTQAGPSEAGQGAGSKGTRSGSRFANLDNYLANNNAKAFGEQFGGKIQGSIDQARGQMDQTAGRTMGEIQNYNTGPSQAQIDQAVAGAGDNTTQADADQFKGWREQTYQGPKSLADNQQAYGQFWGQANKAKTEADLAQKESGRYALLDQYFGRPSYNSGEKTLDNLLIQSGGGFSNPKALQDQAASLKAWGTQQAQGVSDAAGAKEAQVNQTRTNAQKAVADAQANFQKDLDARTKAANDQRKTQFGAIGNDLKDTHLTRDSLNELGLLEGTKTYGLNLQDYLTGGQDVGRDIVAADADYAKYRALSSLAGLDPTYLNMNDRANAGKLPDLAAFDQDRFKADAGARESAYLQAASGHMKELSALQAHRESLERSKAESIAGGRTSEVAHWDAALAHNQSLINDRTKVLKPLQAQYKVDEKIRWTPDGEAVPLKPSLTSIASVRRR